MELRSESYVKYILLSVISVSFSIYSSFYFIKRYKYQKEFNKLKALRDDRISQKRVNLKSVENYFNENNNIDIDGITNKSFFELLNLLKTDNSRSEVLYAYKKKAFEVNSKLNCIVDFVNIDKSEINYDGPLSGMPISFKENLCIKDYYSCAGCSYFLTNKSSENCVLVDVIKNLGGVPFVTTTVPQSMMSFLSSNPIDGVTLNPLDVSKSPGGSSSGEGALIGAHGSILGIGTDIGGSVRIPAAFCGIVGFKPTNGRLSKKGLLSITKNPIVTGTCGILGRDVDSIAFLFEKLANSTLHRQLDPTIVPMDYNKSSFESKSKLTIGYFLFDESYKCVPAIERSVLEVVKQLEKNGHKIIQWKPPVSGEKWLTLFLSAISADRGKDIRFLCQYDKKDSTIRNLLKLFELNYFQYIFKLFQAHLDKNNESIIWLNASRGISSSAKLMEIFANIKGLKEVILAEWEKFGIDVIICPTSGFTTLPVKPIGSLTGMLSYQNLWNLVDFPAGTVPVSKVSQEDITSLFKNYPRNSSVWHLNTFIAQKDSVNMPVSVQCVAKPWKEEMCLRIMKEIEITNSYTF